MLESEMKEKVCPKMLLTTGLLLNVGESAIEQYEYSLCLGSGCAMWEEETRPDPHVTPYGRLPYDPPEGDCGLKRGGYHGTKTSGD